MVAHTKDDMTPTEYEYVAFTDRREGRTREVWAMPIKARHLTNDDKGRAMFILDRGHMVLTRWLDVADWPIGDNVILLPIKRVRWSRRRQRMIVALSGMWWEKWALPPNQEVLLARHRSDPVTVRRIDPEGYEPWL